MKTLKTVLVALAGLAVAAGVAQAGGRARVTAMSVPANVTAGAAFDLAFTVRPETFGPDRVIEPTVIATCNGQTVTVAAARQGTSRRYTATLKLPQAGHWLIKVDSRYCQTVMNPVSIAAAPAKGASS